MPLSSDKCVLERDRALDLIDDIRAQFPVSWERLRSWWPPGTTISPRLSGRRR